MKTFTYLQYITLNIDLYCRVFIDERKTQQNRQERRREKVKKTHESQMSELKRYVQNVRTISLIWGTIICSSGFNYHYRYINLIYNSTINFISVDWYVQKWRNRVQTSSKRRMFCVRKLSKVINRLHTSNYERLLLVIWNVFRDKI